MTGRDRAGRSRSPRPPAQAGPGPRKKGTSEPIDERHVGEQAPVPDPAGAGQAADHRRGVGAAAPRARPSPGCASRSGCRPAPAAQARPQGHGGAGGQVSGPVEVGAARTAAGHRPGPRRAPPPAPRRRGRGGPSGWRARGSRRGGAGRRGGPGSPWRGPRRGGESRPELSHVGACRPVPRRLRCAPMHEAQQADRRLGADEVEVLLPAERLRARVAEIGREITRDYDGKPLVLVGVLKGALVFLADLMRAIDLPVTLDFVGLSSYVGAADQRRDRADRRPHPAHRGQARDPGRGHRRHRAHHAVAAAAARGTSPGQRRGLCTAR